MKKISFIIFIIIIIALVAVSVSRIKKKNKAARNFSENPTVVYSYRVVKKDISKTQNYIGNVISDNRVEVSSMITRRITHIYKEENDKVKPGDLLIKLDDRDIKEKINAVKSNIESLKSSIQAEESKINSAEENLKYWDKELKRNKELLDNDALPQDAYDKTENSYEKAKSDIDSLRYHISTLENQLVALNANLREMKVMLSYTNIVSNVVGVVSKKIADDGDLAPVGKPLLIIDSTDSYKINFSFSSEDAALIKPGLKTIVEFSEDKYINTKITKVYPAVSANQTATAEIILSKLPFKNISLIGQYVRVKVIVKKKKDVLAVPENSLLSKDNKDYVYQIAKDRLKLKEVKKGISDGYYSEIVKGLKENDSIASGSFLDLAILYDNQKIIIYGEKQ